MHVPLDWLFGTYAGCKEEVIFCPLSTISIFSLFTLFSFGHVHFQFHKFDYQYTLVGIVSTISIFKVSKIWHGQKSGEEANETAVHAASAKAGKVE